MSTKGYFASPARLSAVPCASTIFISTNENLNAENYALKTKVSEVDDGQTAENYAPLDAVAALATTEKMKTTAKAAETRQRKETERKADLERPVSGEMPKGVLHGDFRETFKCPDRVNRRHC